MATVTLQGNQFNTSGNLPQKGGVAPNFKLVKSDLSEATLDQYRGKKVVLNIFPSLDTDVCALSVRKFNEEIVNVKNSVVLAISRDLPFAHGRFCTTEGIKNVTGLSEFRDFNFSEAYGVQLIDGPLAGLMARSVVVLNENGEVIYTELVPEITQEPDYNAALTALKS